jgi:DUF4097 and DUF4098 domain-containing protein YvlB
MKPVFATVIVLLVIVVSMLVAFSIPSLYFSSLYSNQAVNERINDSNIYALNINDPSGYIYIGTWNGSQIQVSYVSTYFLINPQAPSIKASNGTLDIYDRSIFTYFFGYYALNIKVLLPDKMAPDISVSSVDGSISINVPATGITSVTTTNGNIETNISHATQIKLITTNGNINLYTLEAKNVYASTVNGRIYANLNGPLYGNYIFKDVNGNINVLVPPNVSVAFTLSSINGGYGVSGIPLKSSATTLNGVQGVAGNGSAYLRESTTNGNAFLKANQ